MEDALLLIAVFVFFFSHLFRDHREKERQDHEWWVSDCRNALKAVSCEFEQSCWEITDRYFEQHNRILCGYSRYTVTAKELDTLSRISRDHLRAIKALKMDYLENPENASAWKSRMRNRTPPDYLMKEYQAEVSDIADAFFRINDIMRTQAEEIRPQSIEE